MQVLEQIEHIHQKNYQSDRLLAAKGVKKTFGLGLQGSKRPLSPPKLTDPEGSPTTAKAPEKKDIIMDPTQLQLLFDKIDMETLIKAMNEMSINYANMVTSATQQRNWNQRKTYQPNQRHQSNQPQKYEYNENSQPKKVNYCEVTKEINDNNVWVEELYNMDQPITEKRRGRPPRNNAENKERKQKAQIPEIDESGDHDEDNADELFDELEYESEELEELESFSSDCISSDEESIVKKKKDTKIVEIESPAVCLAVMEEIPTDKKVPADEKPTIEEQLNKIIDDTNIEEKYKESVKELFKNNKNLFANGLEELG
ncbi:19206_t:CDS:2 [Racocetra fulgida]|uniref:19206_t:CDS:1 n=1 Tax=Racocetra fulgida TaxID=60492 RepID=A0A9N8VVQ6_9GLOM|nr:19206_t:CDS:2 [Racocetra fulgida]